jgi:hypothetical protein
MKTTGGTITTSGEFPLWNSYLSSIQTGMRGLIFNGYKRQHWLHQNFKQLEDLLAV